MVKEVRPTDGFIINNGKFIVFVASGIEPRWRKEAKNFNVNVASHNDELKIHHLTDTALG